MDFLGIVPATLADLFQDYVQILPNVLLVVDIIFEAVYHYLTQL